jgi:nucleoside-diphosphate-sugar epimerase
LKRHTFDVIVDWIAYTPNHVEADIGLFKGLTSQYIFISSASAYQKPATHYLITESTPLANPYWQYSRDKIACEELLLHAYREKGFPVTIVRPSLTYGVQMIPAAVMSWNHPWTLVDRMRKGKKIIVQGDGTSLWTMTHNSDLAKGFVGLMGNIHAIGNAFHITSDEVLTWDQIVRAIGAAAGVEPALVHVTSELIAAFDPDSVGNLLGDKAQSAVFDNTKIKTFVPGYVATTPFAEGVRRSVQWFEAHPRQQTIDEGFNALSEKIIASQARAFDGR